MVAAAAAAAAAEGRFGTACSVAARGRCVPELQISSRTPPPFQFPFSPFAGGYASTFGDPNDATAQGCSILGLLQRQGLLAAAASPLSEDSGRSSAGPAAAAYRCPICMAAFPSTWLLEQHSTLQHSAPSPSPGAGSEDGTSSLPGDDEKPFKCEQCGQSYRYRSAYLKHREQNHRARLPADKLFTCDVCGMQFRYLKSFKKHRLNHALEKLHSKSPSDLDVFARAVRGGSSASIFGERPFRPPSSNQPESTSDYGSSRDSPFALMPGGSASGGRLNGDASGLFSPPPALIGAGRESGRVTAPPTTAALSSSIASSSAGATSPSAASSSSAADGGSDQVSSSNEAVGSNASDSGVSAVFERSASVPVSKSEQQNFYKFSVDDYYYAGIERKGTKTERASDGEQDETIDSLAFALSVQAAGGAAAAAGAVDATAAAVAAREAALRSAQEASLINFLRLDAAERQRERRFACPFCGKCVRSKENLKLHVRKHTGERPFVCLFCGRAFGGKSDLTRHLRIHTGERPYHCEMCGKCFARADYLSKHLTTHIHNSQR